MSFVSAFWSCSLTHTGHRPCPFATPFALPFRRHDFNTSLCRFARGSCEASTSIAVLVRRLSHRKERLPRSTSHILISKTSRPRLLFPFADMPEVLHRQAVLCCLRRQQHARLFSAMVRRVLRTRRRNASTFEVPPHDTLLYVLSPYAHSA